MDLSLPWVASAKWAFGAFLLALVGFHALFIWILRFGRTAWKIADYVWLSFGTLGMAAGIASSRQAIASSLGEPARSIAQSSFTSLMSRIEFGRSVAVCRSFTMSPDSPADLDRVQDQFDALCAWFHAISDSVLAARNIAGAPISVADIGGEPPPTRDEYPANSLREDIDRYNQAVADVDRLAAKAEWSGWDWTAAIAGPFLLALALALRITKVTGELKLDRASVQISSPDKSANETKSPTNPIRQLMPPSAPEPPEQHWNSEAADALRIAQQLREYHHQALWEEEKHFTWLHSIILAAQVAIFTKQELEPRARTFLLAGLAVIGLLFAFIAIRVVRREGMFFSQANSLFVLRHGIVFPNASLDLTHSGGQCNSLFKRLRPWSMWPASIRGNFQLVFVIFATVDCGLLLALLIGTIG